MEIRLRFGDLLRKRGITPNRLAQHGKNLSRNTIYGLANPPADRVRVDLDVLAAAIQALEELTGSPIAINDVLEIIETPEPHNPALIEALKTAKPLDLKALDDLADPNAEDPSAWLERNRDISRKALKMHAKALGQGR